MDWPAFASALVGGCLVLFGQIVMNAIKRGDLKRKQIYEREERIASLALEVVNWLESDKQLALQNPGQALPLIPQGHPVYKLAAAVKNGQPKLSAEAQTILHSFQDYCDVTRAYLPRAHDAANQRGLARARRRGENEQVAASGMLA